MSDADIETRYARLVADPDFERRVARAARSAMEALEREVLAESHAAAGVRAMPGQGRMSAHWRGTSHPLH